MEIINILAGIYDDLMIAFNNAEIPFYVIMIGLGVLNFIIYELCFFIRRMKYDRLH